jgi:major membrane immunogen (membrane-anchored lipoprotein)
MKKLMFIAMISLSTMLVGCGEFSYSHEDASDRDKAWMSHGNYTSTKVVEIEGHKYIIMVGFKAGNIIHAESCRCKK